MTKTKYIPLIGKFIELAFTYRHKKNSESKYIKAFGEITSVEDKYLEFVDNDNFDYIIDLNKIWECNVQDKSRRTKDEWEEMLDKEVKKKFKTGRL
jgi:hypothetical protein